jgi:NADP-dependent 3-hydroxy acid dehydrogenase YdfG
MPRSVEGTSALVTGASRGIGLEIARALRARGAEVIMVARSHETLAAEAERIGATALIADLASQTQVDGLVGNVLARAGGAPDVLVNAAGAFGLAPVAETSVVAFDEMIAANLRAPFLLMRALLPYMLERGSGHIVSIGSISGRQAFAANGAYSASKFGLRGLHEVLDVELRGSGVRATLVEPAATDTPLWDAIDTTRNPGLPERSQMLAASAVAAAVLFAIEQPAGTSIKYIGLEKP